ncbi:MAG: fused response regulator/phosphatase [Thermodesulfobacteriota bacterium]
MTGDTGKLSILVVDDSEIVLRFASRVLAGLDTPIYTAENGRLALEHLGRHHTDLLITDLMMPEMDGFDLISKVRADERFQGTHIIVMTALDQVRDKVRALQLGANDYTVKPLDAAEFRARVQSGLREMRLKRQLSEALASLDHELKLVAALQRRLLPKTLPHSGRFRSAVAYEPCRRAGGDYYDWFMDAGGRLVVTVADVSGHGASAAVLMAMLKALFRILAADGESAAEIVGRLNSALLEHIGEYSDFVTCFLGLIDPRTGRLNYCSAGHGDMMILGPDQGRIRRLPAGGTVLGCFKTSWEEEHLDLEPGQTLVLYTDGLVEAVNAAGEEFGRNRLEEVLALADPGSDPDELVERIRAGVDHFVKESDLVDDLTLFLLKIT